MLEIDASAIGLRLDIGLLVPRRMQEEKNMEELSDLLFQGLAKLSLIITNSPARSVVFRLSEAMPGHKTDHQL